MLIAVKPPKLVMTLIDQTKIEKRKIH